MLSSGFQIRYAGFVSAKSKSIRRTIGTLSIAVAIAMLVVGETVLKSRLTGIPMLCYWMTCFIFTAIAAGAALIDAARVRSESREEKRALIEKTIKGIENKPRKGNK